VKKSDTGDLFEAFSDPRPSGSATGTGEGFRKYLEERGEYPFKDRTVGGYRVRGALRGRMETLLVVALAFLITNIAAFSVGVWNGKRGTVRAETPAGDAAEAEPLRLPDVAPRIVADPVPAPEPAPPEPVAAPTAPAAAEEGKYVIRLATVGTGQSREAHEIAQFFESRGFKPAQVRTLGKNLVIEVGSFSSMKSPQALKALRDAKDAKYRGSRFADAMFVKVK
jgi:hypothetical protein